MRAPRQRIFSMRPASGFAAQVAGGSVIYVATRLGFPVSTTHVVSGSVLGAGSTKQLSAVRWGLAGNIVFAWLLTIPAAALVAAAFYWPIEGSSRFRAMKLAHISDLHCGEPQFVPGLLVRA